MLKDLFTTKIILLLALLAIAIYAMYTSDKITLATIVGAFVMKLKQDD